MNHRAKFDDASFILGGEIHNRTHTKKQTVARRVDVRSASVDIYVSSVPEDGRTCYIKQ